MKPERSRLPTRPLCFACLVAALLPCAVNGAMVLDQEFAGMENDAGLFAYQSFHPTQTFTVGRTGELARLELQVARDDTSRSPTTLPLFAEIRRTRNGIPDMSGDALLATLTFPADSIHLDNGHRDVFTGVDLGGQSIGVTAGELLAIVLRSDAVWDSVYVWTLAYNGRGTYPGGAGGFAYERLHPDYDLGFRTYVAVPEPAALLPVAAALALLPRRRKPRAALMGRSRGR